jgi:hypothetical protein
MVMFYLDERNKERKDEEEDKQLHKMQLFPLKPMLHFVENLFVLSNPMSLLLSLMFSFQ